MVRTILKYVSVLLVYFVVDVAYQVVFGIPFASHLQQKAGISDIYAEAIWFELIAVWFVIITVAIVHLVVNPAVANGSVREAVVKGLLLGVAAYATLGLANGWSLADFPLMLVAEITLEGVLFAPIAAAVTTWWMLRWKGDA